jgi:hypothetical protein
MTPHTAPRATFKTFLTVEGTDGQVLIGEVRAILKIFTLEGKEQ